MTNRGSFGSPTTKEENTMPKYENECNHAPEDFFGTVRLDGVDGDLYFYTDEFERVRYCFRYGPQGAYSTGWIFKE